MARTLTVYLAADTKKASAEFQSFESSLMGVGKAMAGLFVGSQVASWFVDATKAAADAEASQTKYADALKRTGLGAYVDELQAYNTELSRQTGYDDDLIADAGAILSRFTSDKEALKQATAAAVDYAEATGTDVPAAAQAIGKAAMGNTKALKSLGIDYKATGDSAADFGNVVEQIGEKVGGTASMDTAAKSLRSLDTIYGNLQESIGSALLPVLDDLAAWFQAIVDVMQPAIDGFTDMTKGADAMQESIGSFLGGTGIDFKQWMMDSMNLSAAFGQALGPFADAMRVAGEQTDRNNEALAAMGYKVDEATGALVKIDTATKSTSLSFEELADDIFATTTAARGLIEKVSSLEDAEDALMKMVRNNEGALNKQKTAFNLNTSAGREQAAAMNTVAEKTEAAWQEATDQGKHAKAQRILEEGIAKIESAGRQWGMSKEDAERYRQKILDIPKDWHTDMAVNTAEAERQLNAFLAKVRGASGTVTVPIRVSGLPSNPPSGSGNAQGRSAPVNVTVQAGIGDPVAIARMIEKVLDTRSRRLGL